MTRDLERPQIMKFNCVNSKNQKVSENSRERITLFYDLWLTAILGWLSVIAQGQFHPSTELQLYSVFRLITLLDPNWNFLLMPLSSVQQNYFYFILCMSTLLACMFVYHVHAWCP